MGGSLDPTEMVPIVSGPPGKCWPHCGDPAVLMFEASSGRADAIVAKCPACWMTTEFAMRVVGVWLGDHWLIQRDMWDYGHLSDDLAAQLGVVLAPTVQVEALHIYDTPDTPPYPPPT